MSNYNYSDLLKKYLQDNISREELHALEKRALDDPFLMDAMEGFASSDLKKSFSNIDQIKTDIQSKQISSSNNYRNIMSIAAGLAILVTAFFVFNNYNNRTNVLSDQIEISTNLQPQKDQTTSSSPSPESIINSEESTIVSEQKKEINTQEPKSAKTQQSRNKKLQKEKTKPPEDKSKNELIDEDEIIFADLDEDQVDGSGNSNNEKKDQNKKSEITTKPMRSRGRILINQIESTKETFKKSDLPTEEVTVKPILGLAAFENYIRKNKKSFGVNGKVVIDFTIRPDGQAINFRVFESLCRACDEDAIRLIREGGSWLVKPAEEEVDVRYEIEY